MKKTNGINPLRHEMAKIKVVGVGGGGGNAVSRMRNELFKGVDFIAINTDTQDLELCNAHTKIHIGKNLTKGLGTGMNPDLGRQAAEETRSEIVEAIKGADLVFVTAGLGGGTGTGASPVVAEASKELGALTIAVVTKPFSFEGSQRARIAQEGFMKLKDKVDALIVVPNDRIFSVVQKDTTIIKAFEVVDDILRDAVRGIAELIAMPGIVNVDFADVKTIMENAGTALVGIGAGSGQERAATAVSQAINSPLLETSIDGAKGVLFGISGTRDLRMSEINEIAKKISESVDPAAKIIFGAYHDRAMKPGQIKVTIVATGFSDNGLHKSSTMPLSNLFSSGNAERKADIGGHKDEKTVPDEGKASKSPKKSSDVWDIPTFLRKNKK
ncbi:MAG: cell division protein FtsZ [Candidatus Zambryskibacteria bacterium RIFCSPLOWO2_01_FULL_45_43]|uniref:Cell division protein FtsZ n=2 Tax=Parcubacteria group TaxID=1794811 RepID=A0A1G1ZT54_9BACT|nr:MAG: cell division protein FtsZ [Candidatus Harrisonbacteria bacterium RIFCSPLOWO2_02_FULL_45_10c]OHB06048.1 MAG: cell division protein FtsZ [Candidatus Zambryskibacteria bacterium RIFCSPLOWO2_01_FULL_45_43]